MRDSRIGTPTLQKVLGLDADDFVVIFEGSKNVVNSIYVPVTTGVIADSQEKFYLKLNEPALKACVGDGIRFLGIREVREVVLRFARSKKRRSRKQKTKSHG